jgi:2-oxoglutarate ferredoxin oxidoreductase subunit alpha
MNTIKEDIAIKFAGDSGDGMQLTGTQFTDNTALYGNDFVTFPNYPAEIRAPQGTLHGVSGFQIHFGSREINTPGDDFDVLVAMNAAALKDSLGNLKIGGLVIVDSDGFDKKNLRLAGFDAEIDLLSTDYLDKYEFIKVDATKLTREALKDFPLDAKIKDRSKNMFVLGLILWIYGRNLESVNTYLSEQFSKNEALQEANKTVVQAGYFYGDTAELSKYKTIIQAAHLAPGIYRNIMGNKALALGLMAASAKVKLPLFYGSYPITPASDILHELAKHTHDGVQTFQAEDEIAAASSAIGASFGGALGVTGTSGPGLALKSEAINLALMLELPLVIVDVQRAGPSTGMPTKTEQSDLLFAMFGRNGESPMPIVAASSPSNCFDAAFWACKLAVEHMTPVILLSDGYLANGSEPWKFPTMEDLPNIQPNYLTEEELLEESFLPYQRNQHLVRKWVAPGTLGKQHRIGGIEKELNTGNVSYNPENHHEMTRIRAQKVANIAHFIPNQEIVMGESTGDLLILGWGNTKGVIKSATKTLISEGKKVAHVQVNFINPFPKNLGMLLSSFKNILVPELNYGQLIKLLKLAYPESNFMGLDQVKGIPFKKIQILDAANIILEGGKL